MDQIINIKNKHSPHERRISQPHELVFYSQEHLSKFESFEVSGQVLNEKNKNIVNLTNMTIVHQTQENQKYSPINNKKQKENRFMSVQQQKILQKLRRPTEQNEAKPNDTNDDSNIILSIKEYDVVSIQEQQLCIYCSDYKGQLRNYCKCKKIHQECLKRMNESLNINVDDPQIRVKLTCSECKVLLHIKLKSQFQFLKCKDFSNILFMSFVSLLMLGIFSFLMYFIIQNKKNILFQPDLFSGIVILTIISLILGVWIAGIVLKNFIVWVIHFKVYQPNKSLCQNNEKLVALVEKQQVQ